MPREGAAVLWLALVQVVTEPEALADIIVKEPAMTPMAPKAVSRRIQQTTTSSRSRQEHTLYVRPN